MKLIKFVHRLDYGHDWYVQVLFTKKWALLQASVSWSEYPGWPYFQIKTGSGSLLDILFWAHKFGISIDFLSRTWNWDRLKDIDFKLDEL